MANIAPKSVLVLQITTPAGNGNTDLTVTRPFVVIGVHALATTGGGAGTIQVLRAANPLTDVMALGAAANVSRCLSLVLAQVNYSIGDVIRVTIGNDVAASGIAYVSIIPSAIPGNA